MPHTTTDRGRMLAGGGDPARGHLLEIFFTTGTTHRGVLRRGSTPSFETFRSICQRVFVVLFVARSSVKNKLQIMMSFWYDL